MLAPRVRGSILTTGNTSNSCRYLPMDRVRLHIFIRLRSQPSSANATKRSQRRSYNRAWLNYDGQDGSNTWLFVGKPTISSHFSWILEFCAQWWLETTAGVRFASNHEIESSEQEVAWTCTYNQIWDSNSPIWKSTKVFYSCAQLHVQRRHP